MIKPWQERVKKEFHGVAGVTAAYMQSEINELRAAFDNLHSDYDIIEIDREELRAERDALKALTLKLAIGAVALAYEAGALFSVDEVRELMNPFESQVDSIFAGEPSFEDQVCSILKEAAHAI